MLDTNLTDRLALILLGMVVCLAGMNVLKAQDNEEKPVDEPRTGENLFGVPVEGEDRLFVNVDSPDEVTADSGPVGDIKLDTDLFSTYEAGRKIDSKKVEQQIAEAIKTLRKIEDPKLKEQASTEFSHRMKKYFTAYFNDDMQRREEQFAPLETRVKKMRAFLDKRQAAREKIIDLQIQVILNQADGLGLISTPEGFEPVRQSGPEDPFGFEAGSRMPTPISVPSDVPFTDVPFNGLGLEE